MDLEEEVSAHITRLRAVKGTRAVADTEEEGVTAPGSEAAITAVIAGDGEVITGIDLFLFFFLFCLCLFPFTARRAGRGGYLR